MKKGLVSIIIPCFNQGQYIFEATDSILNQSYGDFEIIVVNDGSTDSLTNSILATLERPNLKVIKTKNQGLAMARNTGIKNSQGEFFIPLDCDDKLTPKYIEKTMAEIEKDEAIGVVYSDIKVFGNYEDEIKLKQTFIPEILIENKVSVTSLVKRTVFDKILKNNGIGYNPNMEYGYEDWDFWISAIEAKFKLKHIPEPLFLYRKVGPSMIANAEKHHIYLINQIMENHKESFKEFNQEVVAELQNKLKTQEKEISKLNNGIKEYETKNRSITYLVKRLIKVFLMKIGLKSKD